MAKIKTIYSCTECGATSPKWQGQCPGCNDWNTLVETVAEKAPTNSRFESLAPTAKLQNLSEIEAREVERIATGIGEFDRALGGGLVNGAVVLIGGDPGIGKSTLLLQALAHLSVDSKVLYVSGEESGEQVALRARRLGLDTRRLQLMAEINLERILATLQAEKPVVAVIDSIQTLWSDQLSSAPGSVAQVRECAAQLTRLAKQAGITVILVGHVTKEGALAGPRVLEHIVDTVLYFEGDTHSSFRLVRAVKNRFGAVNELGVFAMTDKGLKGVNNPSALFLSQHGQDVAGSCVMVTQEGTRPLLVEVQALVDKIASKSPLGLRRMKALIDDGLTLRPDWGAVITPVVDFLSTRPDVDPARIGLVGLSLGAHLGPRAAADEHRLAALVADCGAFDLYAPFLQRLPGPLRAGYTKGERLAVDTVREMLDHMAAQPTAGWSLRRGMQVHGVATPMDYIEATREYTLAGHAERISCPTFVCNAENDPISATAPTLVAALTCPKEFVTFTAAEGAGEHCESMARDLYHARSFGWLDAVLRPGVPG